MIGIIALFIIVILFVVVHSIAYRFSVDFSQNDDPKLRKRLYWSSIGFLVFILVGDEIIGGTQMAYFCLSEPEVQVLVDDLAERTVKGTSTYHDKENAILTVKKGEEILVDVESQEIVATGYRYTSQGGWLSRAIAFNDSKAPLLFGRSCSNVEELYKLIARNQMIIKR